MGKKKSRVVQKTRQLQENVVDLLEMPPDVMLDLPKVTMIGRQKLLLENHRGIIEYGLTRVRVRTTAGL
ncbi:MAG TPA: sporulation protein YqfC, partial [Clostridia bacterium]|nr:sporulation protein YqfC [Clostridia bacterium]